MLVIRNLVFIISCSSRKKVRGKLGNKPPFHPVKFSLYIGCAVYDFFLRDRNDCLTKLLEGFKKDQMYDRMEKKKMRYARGVVWTRQKVRQSEKVWKFGMIHIYFCFHKITDRQRCEETIFAWSRSSAK